MKRRIVIDMKNAPPPPAPKPDDYPPCARPQGLKPGPMTTLGAFLASKRQSLPGREPTVRYAEWIAAHVPRERIQARGRCSSATIEMVEAFPELRRARGHYVCPIWGRQEHWWCVAPDGSVVDPTGHQFPSCQPYPGKAGGVYKELPADAPEPIGKCMICGSYCWEGKSPSSSACSKECERELEVEYGCT